MIPGNLQPVDLLVVATHPDDAEISVGGTILRARAEGLSVAVLDLTDGEPTPFGDPVTRARETAQASAVLGLTWREQIGLCNRSLQNDLESRRCLAGAFRQARPRLILAPYWEDAHPDHIAASQLVDAARFWAKLSKTDFPGEPFHPPRVLYYWSIHLRIHPRPQCVVDISPFLETKLQAIRCYASQFVTGRAQTFPTPLDDIRDRARYWGWSIGQPYGEPLASREELPVSNIRSLLGGFPVGE